jgi:hypothetical protein
MMAGNGSVIPLAGTTILRPFVRESCGWPIAFAAFLVQGNAVPMPTRANLVFAVLLTNKHGAAGLVYFCKSLLGPLTLLDCEQAQFISPALLNGTMNRLNKFADVMGAYGLMGIRARVLYTSALLKEEMSRLGHDAVDVIDGIAGEGEALAVAASVHINAGRVKIAEKALARAEHQPVSILDATIAYDDNDPARLAALVGIALVFDAGRSLGVKKPRAA